LDDVLGGSITEELKAVAEDEGKTPEFICRGIASGELLFP
jgi:thiamine biosynthesis protein ThiC